MKRRSTEAKVMDLALALVGSTTKAAKPKRAAKKRAIKPPAVPKPLYQVRMACTWCDRPIDPLAGGRMCPGRGRVPHGGNCQPSPFTILGLDPSLTHTAAHIGVMDVVKMGPTIQAYGDEPVHRSREATYRKVTKFSLQTAPANYAHRLHRFDALRGAFLRMLDEMTRKHGVGLLVVEGYSLGSVMGKTTERIEWGGQIRMSAYSMGWDVLEVPPSTLKYWLTGNGAAKKPQMMDAVFQRFRYKCTDDNDADAFALSQLGGAFIRWRLGATVTSDEASQFQRLEVWEAKHGRC